MYFPAAPAAFVSISILTLLGFGLTRLSPSLRTARLPIRLGFAFPVGLVTTSGLLYALSHLGVLQIRRTTILLVAGVVLAASLVPRVESRGFPRRIRRFKAPMVIVVFMSSLVGLVLLGEALARPVSDWDGRETWGFTGRMVRGSRSADVPAFRDPTWWFPPRHYPVMMPISQNLPLELFASEDEREFRPIYAALFLSGLLVVFDGVARLAGRTTGAVVTTILTFVPHLTFWNHGGPSGAYSDYPLAVFLGGGLVLGLLHPRRSGTRLLSGLLLAGAALTKVEGLPLATAALLAIGLADLGWLRNRGSLRSTAIAIIPVLALIGVSALLLNSWRQPLVENTYGRFLHSFEPSLAANRLREAIPVVFRETVRPDRWGLLWPVSIVAIGVGWRGMRSLRSAGLALVLLSLVLGAAIAYVGDPKPAGLARVTWGRFLVQGHVPLMLLLGAGLRRVGRLRPYVLAGLALATVVPTFAHWRGFLGDFAKTTWVGRRDDATAANARLYGAAYVAGVDEIRRRLPPDSPYLLVKATDASQIQNYIRYHLAPRTPRFLGTLVGCKRTYIQTAPNELPSWVVLAADPGEPPRLESTASFAAREPDFFVRGEDDSIPGSIDSPSQEAAVGVDLRISGWCQESGSRPCSDVLLMFDGCRIPPTSFDRYPRPDVEAALPGMGSCARAGFSGTWTLPETMIGKTISIRAIGVSADRSRHRNFTRQVMVEAPRKQE